MEPLSRPSAYVSLAIVYALVVAAVLLVPLEEPVKGTSRFLAAKVTLSRRFIGDVLLNVALFIPWGFLFYATARSCRLSRGVGALLVIIGTAAFALSVETFQYLTASRYSSLIDTATNLVGASFGVTLGFFKIR
jgi:glycopeptide antibiotics resistance protein